MVFRSHGAPPQVGRVKRASRLQSTQRNRKPFSVFSVLKPDIPRSTRSCPSLPDPSRPEKVIFPSLPQAGHEAFSVHCTRLAITNLKALYWHSARRVCSVTAAFGLCGAQDFYPGVQRPPVEACAKSIKNDASPVTKKPGLHEQLVGLLIASCNRRNSAGISTPSRPGMPRFYFHRHLNGQFAQDRRGRQFASVNAACEYAVQRTPAILRKIVASTSNTHLATEITDGKRIVCVVRGKVLIENS
jgi:hypothetical protein